MHHQSDRMAIFAVLGLLISPLALARGQEPAPADAAPPPADVSQLPQPEPVPEVTLAPTLPTSPVRRGIEEPNVRMVDASLLPRDKEGIWVLDFAFKPVRMVTVEIPGKGRKQVHYLLYRVTNRTGEPRMFVPQFTMITRTGDRPGDTVKRLEDGVIPQAVKVIQAREIPENPVPLLGAVQSTGIIPTAGEKEGIDDAVYGVAVWDNVDPEADAFSIYVRGLSDGYQQVSAPDGGEPTTKYKTLRMDFTRPGDARKLNEREIFLADPPYEWIYW